MRFALVPIEEKLSKEAHDKYAFEYGCWSSGLSTCSPIPTNDMENDECGSDRDGFIYQREITVPPVYPDGDYVFAAVWYGGICFAEDCTSFEDFWSCSHVRIEGGEPLAEEYEPKFITGDQHDLGSKWTPEEGNCISYQNSLGNPISGLILPVPHKIPEEFEDGKIPPPITFGIKAAENTSDSSPEVTPVPSLAESPAPSSDPTSTPSPAESSVASSDPIPTSSTEESSDPSAIPTPPAESPKPSPKLSPAESSESSPTPSPERIPESPSDLSPPLSPKPSKERTPDPSPVASSPDPASQAPEEQEPEPEEPQSGTPPKSKQQLLEEARARLRAKRGSRRRRRFRGQFSFAQ
eukprot:Plantae.Rhodophyta-Hildenbrandia_rubra.ctg14125.p1 GENE.Plantae.Rhodophyta-Hildenbrandia_rubra.ctg14125~~Plantae.Rhodophyta-Hildenbrandia_rubra.ctg14125.p1  ORF type:complete len:352 (-),score=64.96 Plantae.Rhodophyta-Hildenbrandia_rubra.ctg14125:196-1251(-)